MTPKMRTYIGGHEGAGVVEEVGRNVTSVPTGPFAAIWATRT
jgi:Zn-dependent alcohol dehydrogenase